MSIYEQLKKILYNLLVYACKICGIIGLILIILFCYGFANRKIIKFKWICIENILMFVLLGIFEYLFFTNVIIKYNPVTDDEIKYFIANYFNSTMHNY